MAQLDAQSAARDLEFIRKVLADTQRCMDPHAFHYVHWGVIVLVWYPLANLFADLGHAAWQLPLGIAALVLGMALSSVREVLLARRPRLPGENTFIGRQVVLIVSASLLAGFVLSGVAPTFGFIDGPNVPVVWGLVYANLAFMTGVVYDRDFLWAGLFIFAGAVAAIVLPDYNGYILGPCMGLGMIVPGTRAERRVRAMRERAA